MRRRSEHFIPTHTKSTARPSSIVAAMKMLPFARRAGALALGLALCLSTSPHAQRKAPPARQQTHSFTVSGKQFLLDGKPFQVISGEMHYTRIPREYWRDRLRKARAMGLNTITTYAFWNVHEPHRGQYDFSGQADLAEYIREAQQEGLYVILRPGPYVCAEWELGGYPAWLLKDRDLLLRSNEPKYNSEVVPWFARLAREIVPLLLKNGGPIIAVQIENEYGSFNDHEDGYLARVQQQLVASGLGDSLLYTANQTNDLARGSLPDVPTVINFGTGDAARSFARLNQDRPDGPRMTGEYWAGWFDKWGEAHHETDGHKEAEEFRWMLQQGYSVSLYMFHGGTTFGWMTGADTHTGADYHPDTTSYDYSAPLDERGEPSYKFELFRKAITEVTGKPTPQVPVQMPRSSFQVTPTMTSASLWRNLPRPVNSKTLLTFEDLDQNYGYVLYRTHLDTGDGGPLILTGVHDYAQVYIDQKLVGTLDRRLSATTLDLARLDHPATLDILVENTGRVNYSKTIRTERAGLTGNATLDGRSFKSWLIYSLPMDKPSALHYLPQPCTGPCFFQAIVSVPRPADTYFDTRQLHKGALWVGDRPIGRFWSIGPQYTLYMPAPWLSKGSNRVFFFDLLADSSEKLSTSSEPVFGPTKSTRESQ